MGSRLSSIPPMIMWYGIQGHLLLKQHGAAHVGGREVYTANFLCTIN